MSSVDFYSDEQFIERVGRTLIVLLLLAGFGDCALFLVSKHQPCDYFSFFSSSVLNPLHQVQNLYCRVLFHFICFSAARVTYVICPFAPIPPEGTCLSKYLPSPGT